MNTNEALKELIAESQIEMQLRIKQADQDFAEEAKRLADFGAQRAATVLPALLPQIPAALHPFLVAERTPDWAPTSRPDWLPSEWKVHAPDMQIISIRVNYNGDGDPWICQLDVLDREGFRTSMGMDDWTRAIVTASGGYKRDVEWKEQLASMSISALASSTVSIETQLADLIRQIVREEVSATMEAV